MRYIGYVNTPVPTSFGSPSFGFLGLKFDPKDFDQRTLTSFGSIAFGHCPFNPKDVYPKAKDVDVC